MPQRVTTLGGTWDGRTEYGGVLYGGRAGERRNNADGVTRRVAAWPVAGPSISERRDAVSGDRAGAVGRRATAAGRTESRRGGRGAVAHAPLGRRPARRSHVARRRRRRQDVVAGRRRHAMLQLSTVPRRRSTTAGKYERTTTNRRRAWHWPRQFK